MARILIRAGFAVNIADDPSKAVSILETRSFEALVLCSGANLGREKDLLTWARKQHTVGKAIVIDLPGSSLPQELLRERAADLVLTRPVDAGSLVGFLSQQLQERNGEESFSGSIEGVDILSYVQFILLSGTKTVLEIYSRDGARGTIYVNKGSICHAALGTAQGERALYNCLSFRGGHVLTRQWREPEKITITKPGEFLLMEAARRRDEALETAGGPFSD